jgi:hypothetical protein
MRPRLVCPPVLVAALVLCAQAASAQGLRERIGQELFTFGDCGLPLCLDLGNEHGNHFLPALNEGNDAVISFLTDAIAGATLRVPLSATSSGATFSVVGGVPVRTSVSAGPIFGERTQTLGRGRFFFGTSVTDMEFTSLNGVPLNNLLLNFKHEDEDPAPNLGDPSFENDLLALNLDMSVNVLVGTVAVTAGLTDFIDVGFAVPIVRTQISGRSEAQILPFGPIAIHRFGGTATDPILRAAASMEGSATGLGDVEARVKINFGQGATMGAGLLGEVRLGTGDEKNLLGSPGSEIRVMGLYSAQLGSFSPHLNVGYAVRTDQSLNDAVLVTGAMDNMVADWLTLAMGVESELQVGANKFVLPPEIVYQSPFERHVPATNIPDKNGDLLRASVGAKFTVRGGTVLVANALLPLRDVGLQPDFIWTLGLDYPF